MFNDLVVNKEWHASRIWMDKDTDNDRRKGPQPEIIYFRKLFSIADPAGLSLIVDLAADSRYKLYINGQYVTSGPSRGGPWTLYYDTLDLSDRLQSGINVIAIAVVHYNENSPRPMSVFSSRDGALLLQGMLFDDNGTLMEDISSNATWKCLRDSAVHFMDEHNTCVGGGENIDGTRLPHGWTLAAYLEDSSWLGAVERHNSTAPDHGGPVPSLSLLAPRPIPFMWEVERAFSRVMRGDCGISGEGEWAGEQAASITRCLLQREAIVLKPHSTFWVELDAGELTTAFLELAVSGGEGSRIDFICSEAYQDEEGRKGIRDDYMGKSLKGYEESYLVKGSGEYGDETYERFLYRTFRFVHLQITVLHAPLTLKRVSYRETGYPLDLQAEFASSDVSLQPLWDISIRTLQRCMHETYVDCPYYEQLQYSMDTRLQILFTYQISGDDRLARKAIHDFHSSLMPSGILQSRYPATNLQIIPGFALYWIMMVFDHYEYFENVELVKRYRPTMDAVLDWVDRQIGADGLVGPAPSSYWPYVDWVQEWEESRGVPASGQRGPITVYNLMYVYALEKAALLNELTGRLDTARDYRERAGSIQAAVVSNCRAAGKQLIQDAPGVEEYSQHAQIWAILSGTVNGEEAKSLARALVVDSSLYKVSYATSFFLFRALSAADAYDDVYPKWEMWKEQVKLNLTTWLEDPVFERSDCHAWGAIPLYEFPVEVLGIQQEGYGYRSFKIAPKPGPLSWAKGKVITAAGAVEVDWEFTNSGQFRIRVAGLGGCPTKVVMPDGCIYQIAGENGVELFHDLITHE
ncbi:alpha-L-rhamnosidase-related protein [Cohnella abietis]|uniref:Alpha-L-rhamnosidase n=1 Tax=Cohnella abietis TaxID=2507935 RepID=A0A3T1DBZ1_9BACL|nr:alpha-L-rhamnosidase C-terminal domain-containing protein [Cohnella abietis]BBI35488.1 hypothetical protein KCTCHS21_48870 [Cohnella abietis]